MEHLKKNRPLSLTIIAWLFIIAGAFSAWDLISQLCHYRGSLDFGFLFIFLGHGLLKHHPSALSWALAMAVLGWVALAIAVVCGLFGVGDVKFGGEVVTGARRFLAIISVTIIYGGFLAWMTHVLRRRDVEDLFQNHVA